VLFREAIALIELEIKILMKNTAPNPAAPLGFAYPKKIIPISIETAYRSDKLAQDIGWRNYALLPTIMTPSTTS